MGRHRKPLIGFDLETTGTDPREARIVTGAVVEVKDGRPLGRRERLADPGVEIPADAVAVHGISSERAAAEGRPADRVADAVADAPAGYWNTGVPVVAYDATLHPPASAASQASRPAAECRVLAHAGAGVA